jgi:hypothetical protein
MKKVKLEVSLNPALNPPVVVSNRDLNAKGRRIRWQRKKNETFTFERLEELDQAYFNKQSISLDRDRINCGNRAPENSTVEYEYVIVVKLNGQEYTSTKPGPNPDGKPVIRN